MTSKSEPETTQLVTCSQLAEELDRSEFGVRQAIRRLGIQPAAVAGRIQLYSPTIVAELRDKMRAPNQG